MPGLTDLFRGGPRLTRRWHANIGDHVISLAWSPTQPLLAAASVGGPVTVFDSATGQVRHTLPGHGFGTTSLAWGPGGALLASAGQDGKVRIWDPTTAQERFALDGGAAWVEHLAWHSSADLLASAAGRKSRLWAGADGRLLRAYPDHPATISALAWRPGRRELTSGTYGGVSLWRPDADEPVRKLEWKGSVLALAWTPAGDRLAHGNQDATVHYWVLKTGEDLQMAGYPTKVRELAWDPTGRYLATGGGDAVTVWDCSGGGPEGSTPLSLKGHREESNVSALAYQARGPLLASGGKDGRLLLFEPGRFKKSLARADLDGAVTRLSWSPDDRLLGAATETGEVAVYSVL
jgi:WD40 repeat protein